MLVKSVKLIVLTLCGGLVSGMPAQMLSLSEFKKMARRKGKPRGKQTMLFLIVHSACGFHKEGAKGTRYHALCEKALKLNETYAVRLISKLALVR
ncbi:hypothetical protein TNCV_4858301 [Trichonephila clavipes]|nr:hypothetical protein TNCV_4858301 [Trichonephila clavipes]